MKKVSVSVPATTANLGAGFDCLGLALNLRSTVEIWEIERGLEIEAEGESEGELPLDATNLMVRAAERVFKKVGRRPVGLHVRAVNGIPLSSGMGSSAAAIIGGLVAANALVDGRLSRLEILKMACQMEGHADNVAATLFGGLVLVSSTAEALVMRHLGVPPLKVVIALPAVRLSTAEARAALPPQVPLKNAVFNIGRALLTAQALARGDFELLHQAVDDRLHQPYRQPLIPGCVAAEAEARGAGAVAVTLSGAGPSLAAFAPSAGRSQAIADAMKSAFEASGVACRTFILSVDSLGAKVKWRLVGSDRPVWAKNLLAGRAQRLET